VIARDRVIEPREIRVHTRNPWFDVLGAGFPITRSPDHGDHPIAFPRFLLFLRVGDHQNKDLKFQI